GGVLSRNRSIIQNIESERTTDRRRAQSRTNANAVSHPDKDRIEHVFATAQGLEGKAREAYLRRECADDDVLREEVDALLVAARESESYFDKLIGQVSAAALVDRAERAHDLEASEARVGDEVGPYTLVALVGIGGMGEVWKA